MTNSQDVSADLLRSSQYQSSQTNIVVTNYVHPDFETDKSETGNMMEREPLSDGETSINIQLPPKEDGDQSDISKSVFRVDMLGTEGNGSETPTPINSNQNSKMRLKQ